MSGALVIVAIILLVAGLFSDGLPLIYASIAVSVASGILLLVGVFQRKPAAAVSAAETGAVTTPVEVEPATLVTASAPTSGFPPEVSPPRDAAPGSVYVVSGRPRYHLARCRFLEGRSDAEAIGRDAAVSAGFTACGVCRPDGAASGVPVSGPAAAGAVITKATKATKATVEDVTPPVRSGKVSGQVAAAVQAPAKAVKAPAKAVKAPAKAVKAPAKAVRAVKAPTRRS